MIHLFFHTFALMNKKINIRNIEFLELQKFVLQNNEKAFRAKQIDEWLWKKSARSFSEMTSISKVLRDQLESHFVINAIKIKSFAKSIDGTIKYAFVLYDESIIEGVIIPSEHGCTACVSSQVGCTFSCHFCATGKLGCARNLTYDEIYDQVAILNQETQNHFKTHLSNIVFMGMGEPLLNYDNLIKAIAKITSEDGLGISPRRITVSTVGIAKMIKKLGDDKIKFHLALSLHAANDTKRNAIMPINEHNSLKKLAEAIRYFYSKTNSRITFEYLLLKAFNDSMNDAKELALFFKNVPCKINIIEYNPIDESQYKKTEQKEMKQFVEYLQNKNIIVNIRQSRGRDIDAACGQLANKIKTNN